MEEGVWLARTTLEAVRVVAGAARGRVLKAPPGSSTRPTSDRVREAIFSMVTSRFDLEGAVVADLFAGSGALGIEALSRGARHATFVESGPNALRAVRENIETAAVDSDGVVVVRSDVMTWAAGLSPGTLFDVIFADPPYAWNDWPRLLGHLAGRAGLLVLETGSELGELGAAWEVLRVKRYGASVVTLAQPMSQGMNSSLAEGNT